MDQREELEMLRRLAALEAKAKGAPAAAPAPEVAAPPPEPELSTWEKAKRFAVNPEIAGFKQFSPFNPEHRERVLPAIGSGFADVALGAKQRYAQLTGNEKRYAELQQEAADKRKIDEQLTEELPGAGVFRTVGQAAPLMVLPGAGVATGIASGAVGGALQPTVEGESAIANTLLGGAAGAVLPTAVAAFKGGKALIGAEGGRQRAAGVLRETLGAQGTREASEAAAQQAAQAQGRAGPGGIRLSTAARAGSDELARLEQASRAKNPQLWAEFDREQAREVAQSVLRATEEAGSIGARQRARKSAWDQGIAEFQRNVDQGVFAQEHANLRANIERRLTDPEAVNPQTRAFLKQVLSDLEGETFGPMHLQQVRANIAEKASPGMTPTPYTSAPRSSATWLAVKDEVDAALDAISGGSWSPVRDAYREASQGVNQAEAARVVRNAFFDPENLMARKTAADLRGEVPNITQAGLATALEKARNQRTGQTLLSPEARSALGETMEAVRRQQIIQQLKKTATAGGGSETASVGNLLVEQARDAALENSGAVGRTIKGIGNLRQLAGGAQEEAALVHAMQDPQAMQQLAQIAQLPDRTRAQVLRDFLLAGGFMSRARQAATVPALLQQ